MIGQTDRQQARSQRVGSLPHRVEWLILCFLILAGFAIRAYNLGGFPDTVLADEADNAQSAVRILYGHPPENGFFGLDWTQQPAFSVYKEAAFIAIFGFNITAMRLPSADLSFIFDAMLARKSRVKTLRDTHRKEEVHVHRTPPC